MKLENFVIRSPVDDRLIWGAVGIAGRAAPPKQCVRRWDPVVAVKIQFGQYGSRRIPPLPTKMVARGESIRSSAKQTSGEFLSD